tara:strand:- start:207 stop:350 length:144 start_codon:yes stop_codon:yes gene_type:complete
MKLDAAGFLIWMDRFISGKNSLNEEDLKQIRRKIDMYIKSAFEKDLL